MPIEAAITGSVVTRSERRTQSGRVRLALTVKVQTTQADPAELIHVSVFEPLLSKISSAAQLGELVYVVGKMRLNRAKSEHGTERTHLLLTATHLEVWAVVKEGTVGKLS